MRTLMKNLSDFPEMESHKVDELDAAIEKVIAEINEENISDIIFYDDKESFYNVFTQKRSHILDEVIREDRRFMLFERRENIPRLIKGLYVKEMPFNTLAFFSCELLESEWEVKEVCVVSKNMKISASKYAEAFKITEYETKDMCGQARVINSKSDNALKPPVVASTDFLYENFIAGAMEVTLHYYGGPMWIKEKHMCPYLLSYKEFIDFKRIMGCFAVSVNNRPQGNTLILKRGDTIYVDSKNDSITVNLQKEPQDSYVLIGPLINPNDLVQRDAELMQQCGDITLPDLPDHVMQKMKDYSKRTLVENFSNVYGIAYTQKTLIALQKYDGDYIARFFIPVCNWVYPAKDTQIDIVETGCVLIKDLLYWNKSSMFDNFNGTLIWREGDAKCTSLEGITKLADDYIACADKIINMQPGEKITVNIVFKDVISKYFSPKNSVLRKLIVMKFSKQFMKVISICNTEERWNEFWKYMNCFSAENWCLETFYIEDYHNTQETELHKMFKLPKGMFQYALDNHYSIMALGSLQKIFCGFNASKKSVKFFTNMNKEDYMEMLEIYTRCETNSHEVAKCMAYLVRMFGPENWRGYMSHIEKASMEDEDYIENYVEYLGELYDVFEAGHKKLVKKANWKNTSIKDLEKEAEALLCLKNEHIYNYADERIAKFQEKWKRYEFEDENYVIRWPEKPVDIAMDGITLNHCGKRFVFPVAMGTTEILFVRRKGKEEKPYFTLEIMDGKVRQFHGFDNCDIFSQPESLKRFLVEFCEQKDIIYNDGEALEEERIEEKDMEYYNEISLEQEDVETHFDINGMFANLSKALSPLQ